MRDSLRVSFIIPTLNASSILPRCLEAIRNQNYPQNKIEIIIADGGSTDNTKAIAKRFNAKVILNPEILHEPGKARASKIAKGQILFFTDADNIIVNRNWIRLMLKPYIDQPNISGILPQTEPPPDSNSFNQYMGNLFTDPFTWFIYGNAANPKDYVYKSLKQTNDYKIYKFNVTDHPLFGLSQGVGTSSNFKRENLGWNDDILAGIKLISEGGLIAYVPKASVYHYHVKGFFDFLKKYRWRIKNNLIQQVKGMGFVNREEFFTKQRKLKKFLFIPYSLSILFPLIDSLKLTVKYRNLVMLWHAPACLGLTLEIIYELVRHKAGILPAIKTAYGE